jgi:hypothetical protein
MDEENERIRRVTKVIQELCRVGSPAIADAFIKYGDWLREEIYNEHHENKRPILTVVE